LDRYQFVVPPLDNGEDVLDLLEARYTGESSYELEKRLREGGIKVESFSW